MNKLTQNEATSHKLEHDMLSYVFGGGTSKSAIKDCQHKWPYPAGWNRATDSERLENWPKYCAPCKYCK